MCGAPHARPTATTWATDDELLVTRMHAGGCVCVAIRQEQRYRRRDGVRRPVRRPGTESATRQLVDFPPPCAASSLAASAGSSRRPVSSCRRRRPWNGPPIGSRAGISGCFRCRRSLPGVPRPARRRRRRSHWTRRRRRRLGRLVKPTTSRTGADRRFGVSRFDVSNRPGSTFAAKYRPTARWRRFSTCTNLEMRLEIESFLRIARGGRAGRRPNDQ